MMLWMMAQFIEAGRSCRFCCCLFFVVFHLYIIYNIPSAIYNFSICQ